MPEDRSAREAEPPTATNRVQDLDGRFYFMNSYKTFVKMLNTALETAYSALNTAIGGGGLTTKCPFFRYDTDKSKFELYYDTEGTGVSSNGSGSVPLQATERLKLYFNSDLWGLVSNFNYEFKGGDEEEEEMSYEIIPVFTGEQPVSINDGDPAGTDEDFYMNLQEYPSTDTLWSPIGGIVFTTSLLPIVNEYTGEPLRFGESNDITNNTSANEFTPIITDIALALSSANSYKGFMEYVPSAEYRMMSLTQSKTEIKNIDIRVFWRDRLSNTLNPVRMYPQSSISVKIMFRKKGLGGSY